MDYLSPQPGGEEDSSGTVVKFQLFHDFFSTFLVPGFQAT